MNGKQLSKLHTQSRSQTNPLFVGSVERAFRVLSQFDGAGTELSLSEVAARSDLGKSAAQRFLYTLTALGYLHQDPQSKLYRMSSKLFGLSDSFVSTDSLRMRAEPILAAANAKCGETINLTVADGDAVVYILRYPSRHAVSVNLSVGTRLPMFCTAPGRVILAYMDEAARDRILARTSYAKETKFTEVDPARIRKIVSDIPNHGYAICNQEAFIGDVSVAAPVFAHRGEAIAAVNFAVPTPRWSLSDVKRELAPLVTEVAEEITQAMKMSATV